MPSVDGAGGAAGGDGGAWLGLLADDDGGKVVVEAGRLDVLQWDVHSGSWPLTIEATHWATAAGQMPRYYGATVDEEAGTPPKCCCMPECRYRRAARELETMRWAVERAGGGVPPSRGKGGSAGAAVGRGSKDAPRMMRPSPKSQRTFLNPAMGERVWWPWDDGACG